MVTLTPTLSLPPIPNPLSLTPIPKGVYERGEREGETLPFVVRVRVRARGWGSGEPGRPACPQDPGITRALTLALALTRALTRARALTLTRACGSPSSLYSSPGACGAGVLTRRCCRGEVRLAPHL